MAFSLALQTKLCDITNFFSEFFCKPLGCKQIRQLHFRSPIPPAASKLNKCQKKQEAVMKCILCGLVLLLASLGLAQQQGQLPPGQSTPPPFPQGQGPGKQMPPDQEAPPAERISSTQVQQQIEQHLNAEPALTSTNVR